jgi:HEAT repeat protein
VPIIRSELSQDSPEVKAAAVRAMGAVRHESAVPDLKLAFQDRAPEVRRDALVAIMALGPERYLSVFESALNWVTPDILDELVRAHGAQVLPHLKAALASSKDDLRTAAFAATRHLEKSARAALVGELVLKSQRQDQRLMALPVAFELMPKKDAIELATALANDKDKRIAVAALDALGQLGAKGARDLLVKAIDGEAEATRVAAAVALLRL